MNYTNKNKKNKRLTNFLIFLFAFSSIIEFININLKDILSIQDTSMFTIIMYLLIVIYLFVIILKYIRLKTKDITIYLLILAIFFVNYLIFPQSRPYLLETKMYIIYILYLPTAIFIVPEITNWIYFKSLLNKWAYLVVALGTMGLVISNYSNTSNYMSYSYSMLLFIIGLYWVARENSNIIAMVGCIVGFIDIIVFGARAPVGFFLLFIILYETMQFKQKTIITKGLLSFLGVGILLVTISSWNVIYQLINSLAIQTQSRFLIKILNNELFYSAGRETIYYYKDLAIQNMGLKVYGLFGDRIAIAPYADIVYVHSIIYEFILSFGFILGPIALMFLLYLIVRAVLLEKNQSIKMISLACTCGIFLRYLVSGSFIIEGNFYLYLAILMNLLKHTGGKRIRISGSKPKKSVFKLLT